jgi:predicted enzyme related to lactoylglutathione lyase
MTESSFTSVVGVLPVVDHAAAVSWYQRWIGRAPDVEPTEGIAEWQLAPCGWLQVSADLEPAGNTTVVVGIADIDTHRAACAAAGVTVGEVRDYGFIKTAEAVDPAGNKILFVQETAMQAD